MKLFIISFTLEGAAFAKRIEEVMKENIENELHLFSVKKEVTSAEHVEDVKIWVQERFEGKQAILFIGACGIAVRFIAPFVKDKFSDSPVLVMDEKGQFVIPILSGHLGGANEIATQIAERMECIPVLTTATDVQGSLAIDIFAKKHDLAIGNREGIAKISQKVLEKKKLTLAVSDAYRAQIDIAIAKDREEKQPLLTLVPREYVLGIGCRKGKEPEVLSQFVDICMKHNNISWDQVKAIATIDRKKEEAAIVLLSKEKNIPLQIYEAATLQAVEGTFTASEFVEKQVGVDNVCERAALAACREDGKLIQRKWAENGMTIAIAKQEWRLTLYEE